MKQHKAFRKLRRGLLAGLLLSACAPLAAIDLHEEVVTRAEWPRHASGRTVSTLPAVRETLRRFEENGRVTIVIYHPGGDPGMRWADELYDWLVSFGVPTRYLELQPGSGSGDRLVVSIIDRG